MIDLAAAGVFLALVGAFLSACVLTGLAAKRTVHAIGRWLERRRAA